MVRLNFGDTICSITHSNQKGNKFQLIMHTKGSKYGFRHDRSDEITELDEARDQRRGYFSKSKCKCMHYIVRTPFTRLNLNKYLRKAQNHFWSNFSCIESKERFVLAFSEWALVTIAFHFFSRCEKSSIFDKAR